MGLGFRVTYGVIYTPIMENQMEKRMENEMKAAVCRVIKRLYVLHSKLEAPKPRLQFLHPKLWGLGAQGCVEAGGRI